MLAENPEPKAGALEAAGAAEAAGGADNPKAGVLAPANIIKTSCCLVPHVVSPYRLHATAFDVASVQDWSLEHMLHDCIRCLCHKHNSIQWLDLTGMLQRRQGGYGPQGVCPLSRAMPYLLACLLQS